MRDVKDILKDAYADEIETVQNYLALSVTLDGIMAEEVKESLRKDVPEELGHAQKIAQRLKELGTGPPGSLEVKESLKQDMLQPPKDSTDIRTVVKGVLKAEEAAIERYRNLFHAAESQDDPVTADLASEILADEEKHRALFDGFLKGLRATPGSEMRH